MFTVCRMGSKRYTFKIKVQKKKNPNKTKHSSHMIQTQNFNLSIGACLLGDFISVRNTRIIKIGHGLVDFPLTYI